MNKLHRFAAYLLTIGFFIAEGFVASAGAQHEHASARAADWLEGYTLIVMSNTDIAAANRARDFVISQGGRIAILVPPRVMLGWISPALAQGLIGHHGIESVSHAPVNLAALKYQDDKTRAAVSFFNAVTSGALAKEMEATTAIPGEPLIGDALAAPKLNYKNYEKNLRKFGVAASPGNSDSMTGTIAVSLFLVESDGSIDPNQYTWSSPAKQAIFNQTGSGLSWWSSKAPAYGENVSFTVYNGSADSTFRQGYEPILHPSTEDHLWINAIMASLGYTSGNHIDRVTAFNTALKTAAGTDWAFSIFVGYNPSPAPTTFTDGYHAYAQFGGPYTQMLSFSFSGLLLTHETGHIFWACDEYVGRGSACNSPSSCGPCSPNGPRPTINNGNCEACNTNAEPCIMRTTASYAILCGFTPPQIGWRGPTITSFSPTNGPAPWSPSVDIILPAQPRWLSMALRQQVRKLIPIPKFAPMFQPVRRPEKSASPHR
jgi:hypothetical protein